MISGLIWVSLLTLNHNVYANEAAVEEIDTSGGCCDGLDRGDDELPPSASLTNQMDSEHSEQDIITTSPLTKDFNWNCEQDVSFDVSQGIGSELKGAHDVKKWCIYRDPPTSSSSDDNAQSYTYAAPNSLLLEGGSFIMGKPELTCVDPY